MRAFQVGGSEMYEVEIEVEAPPPADTDGEITFACEIREVDGGPILATSFHAWAVGRWTYATHPADWTASTVRFTFLRSDLPFVTDGLHVVAWAGWNWGWRDAVGAGGALPSPPTTLMRDFTHEVSDGLAGPLIEAFTLLSRTEGIIPALESAHGLAWISRAREELAGKTVLLNLSGRGDKDVAQMMDILG